MKNNRFPKIIKYLSLVLATIVVFVTVYALILPAITLEQQTAESEGVFFDAADQTYAGLEQQAYEEPAVEALAEEPAPDLSEPAPQEPAATQTENNDPYYEITQGQDSQEAYDPSITGETQNPGQTEIINQEETKTEDLKTETGEYEKKPAMVFETEIRENGEIVEVSGVTADNTTTEKNGQSKKKPIVQVKAEVPEGVFPEGTTMKIKEVARDKAVQTTLSNTLDKPIREMQAVDITFYGPDGKEIEPNKEIKVTITSDTFKQKQDSDPVIIHVPDQGKPEVVKQIPDEKLPEKPKKDEIVFEAQKFSIYAVIYTIDYFFTDYTGDTFKISLEWGPDAKVPDNTEIAAREILPGDEDYNTYYQKALEAVNLKRTADEQDNSENLIYSRFLDISLWADGAQIEPKDDVSVRISLADLPDVEGEQLKVVHFGKDGPEIIDSEKTKDSELKFTTDGFSVYAIVEEHEPATQFEQIETLEQLAGKTETDKFYLYYGNHVYFTNQVNGNGAFIENQNQSQASFWYFEKVPGQVNQYYIFTYTNSGKQYMKNSDGVKMALDSNSGTAFELSQASDGKFYFKTVGQDMWLQHSGSGKGIRLFGDHNNPTNSQIMITCATLPKDPYGLDGKTLGIAYHDNSAISAALTNTAKTVSGQQRLEGLSMVMRPDVLDNEGILLVAEGSDIVEWKFESVQEDQYYLKTMADGREKYLTIDGANVYLSDTPDPVKSLIKATPGTGANSGKWHFSVGNYSLNLVSKAENGFNGATGVGATTWMNLVEKSSVLDDDDFTLYAAQKISVSDMPDGAQVVIYTRIWNETTKRYDFYAVDHNGTLIHCYDTGDGIEWIGSDQNTAEWNFTEYHNSDGTPNYYYELENALYHQYLVPQLAEGTALSPSPVGINMNGRRYGETVTAIIAWNDKSYSYSGLKVEGNRVVPCALDDADIFYFAVVVPPPDPGTVEPLTTVDTIDSNLYGISMKMIDYNNPNVGIPDSTRDKQQQEFFGGDNNNPGLLSTNLDENGYPTSTEITGRPGHSLQELYTDSPTTPMTEDVTHLFINSIYHESGYFEYDSTSNFARFHDNGTFTVYDQLGAIGDYARVTGTHGQFMPFDDMIEGEYCDFTNETNVLGQPLSDTDARKGEKLYDLGLRREVDYHFGMEMEATFTQTADGLDAWGHDIIFEFSGDDDFWFYVDGELVLDLGGVHSAMTGSINFKTGEVKSSRGNSTLYEIFRSNLLGRGKTPEEVALLLDGDGTEEHPGIFRTNDSGQKVFQNYTNHTMKMFYMERGAGASNLHMRFNLAAVRPGTFILSKALSGTDSPANDLVEFPYQIYYRNKYDGQFHLLGVIEGEEDNVHYQGTNVTVPHAESFTPAEGTVAYDHVFFLKPGEAAEVELPPDTVDYYVIECGVNPDIYDQVKANNTVLTGTPTENYVKGTARKDYRTTIQTLENRSKVDYDNHVKDGVMRKMHITKRLYDADGETRLHYPDNPTLFTFRLYLGNENDDPDELPGAYYYPYFVKDPDDHYCKWNSNSGKFDSLPYTTYEGEGGLKEYLDTLSNEEKDAIRFRTSQNGSISNIPADYTVEVRSLIVDTQWKVEERHAEIPKGYTLRELDGYTRVDTDPETTTGTTPMHDTIKVEEDPEVEVRNQKGWGITIDKVWTDKDFMELHDPIYFAVFVKNIDPGTGDISYSLVEDTVHELKTTEDSIYYFFDNLQSGIPFERYLIYEVTVGTLNDDPIEVDSEGYVTNYDPEKVVRINEGETLTIGGKPIGGEYSADGFTYKVHYEIGEPTLLNENIRNDTGTNSRPGIELFKYDLEGNPLGGAVFTLKDSEGEDVAAQTYTSRSSDGLITTAYLSPGETYTLTEIETPEGYVAIDTPVYITVNEDHTITFDPDPATYPLIDVTHENPNMEATVKIKNRTSGFLAKKVDEEETALEGITFALYPQVIDVHGHKEKANTPLPGFEEIVTDENGILPGVTRTIGAGTYYLTETWAPSEYDLLSEDLCFTIEKDGSVTIESGGSPEWIVTETDPETGMVSYILTIPNKKTNKILLKKVDIAHWQEPDQVVLPGAVFDLYRVINGTREQFPLYRLTSGEDGYLAYGELKELELRKGVYDLVEITPPKGYYKKSQDVRITITDSDITYDEGTTLSDSGDGVLIDTPETGKTTILISNSTGVELPYSGGIGTRLFLIVGGILVFGAAILLFARWRMKKL